MEPLLKIWHEFDNFYSSYWLNIVSIQNKSKVKIIISEAKKRHIDLRRCFYPMHNLPAFKKFSDINFDYSNSLKIYEHLICLPSGLNLISDQINAVCDLIEDFI